MAQTGARRGFQWQCATWLIQPLVLHYTGSAEAAWSIAHDGFCVGAQLHMSHNTRRATGRPSREGFLVYGHKLGARSAKAGFDGRRDFVVVLPTQALEAINMGDGNIQTVMDRRDSRILFVGRNNGEFKLVDGQWSMQENWDLSSAQGQPVLQDVTWNRLKGFLQKVAREPAPWLPQDCANADGLIEQTAAPAPAP